LRTEIVVSETRSARRGLSPGGCGPLLEQAGRPIHATQLIRIAWERDVRTEAQMPNYIARLRAKLETLRVPASIVTLRGRGYRLLTEGAPPEEG
jgi:DNA-binding response OmpR family regulator